MSQPGGNVGQPRTCDPTTHADACAIPNAACTSPTQCLAHATMLDVGDPRERRAHVRAAARTRDCPRCGAPVSDSVQALGAHERQCKMSRIDTHPLATMPSEQSSGQGMQPMNSRAK
jgi:hypothetical protein